MGHCYHAIVARRGLRLEDYVVDLDIIFTVAIVEVEANGDFCFVLGANLMMINPKYVSLWRMMERKPALDQNSVPAAIPVPPQLPSSEVQVAIEQNPSTCRPVALGLIWTQ